MIIHTGTCRTLVPTSTPSVTNNSAAPKNAPSLSVSAELGSISIVCIVGGMSFGDRKRNKRTGITKIDEMTTGTTTLDVYWRKVREKAPASTRLVMLDEIRMVEAK